MNTLLTLLSWAFPLVAAAAPPPGAPLAPGKAVATAGVPVPAPVPSSNGLRKSVVSIRVSGQDWDWRAPWSKQGPWMRSYTGVVVAGPRILVTATGLGNATLVEVQKLGEEKRYPARIRLADYEGPLALVDVDDPAFFTDLVPLPLAADVPVDGEVQVLRWLGSNQFEAARANVRQVRVEDHGMSRTGVLTLDMTASISEAGRSEPVVRQGQVVGLTTSKSDDVLLAIASPMLRQFLAAAGQQPYRGFARAGVAWQKLVNPALRAHLGLGEKEGGILINKVLPHGSCAGGVEPGDVLLSVDGTRIDASGQFDHPRYGRLSFALLFSLGHLPGDRVKADILRAGTRQTVELTLRRMPGEADKVPAYVLDHAPEYVERGGLVFQALSIPYLGTFGDWRRRGPLPLLIAQDVQGSFPSADAPRLVVLTAVLPDALNLGYQDERDLIVSRVNGQPVASLEAVKAAFDGPPPASGFHIVEFAPGQSMARMVVDAAELPAASARIQELYGVN
ncbi:MAG: PDZ domain-containing protein [Deltaproteobacteria bacterium]|nr:PDZ domain-containing protein [Deltaproteobacteria bacterium]